MIMFVRFLTVVAAAILLANVFADESKAAANSLGKFKATLLWGTDGSKPDDPGLKDIDSKFRDKLRKVFKWQNYYEVKDQAFTLKPGDKQRFHLSDKCEIEVEHSPS
jgi:hypothetical protein